MQPLTNTWWEIQVLSNRSLEELVFWRLQDFGCQGTASHLKENEALVKAYLPLEKATWLDLSALALWLRQDAIATGDEAPIVKWALIDEEDWSNSWKQHWHPEPIGDAFIIYPAWIAPPTDISRHVLRLDPGSAFGTGAHATTQLCLEALEMRLSDLPADREVVIADIGCGSGILSIGAILLGASQVYAVDTDILAIKATHHNRELNGIPASQLWVSEGSLLHLLQSIPKPVDGFVCNILADVIVDLVPYMHQLIEPNGWGILSGILVEQVPAVIDILEQYNWVVGALWKQKDWSCLNIRRGEPIS
jgi:ribosomal protein L11 methyltransferase